MQYPIVPAIIPQSKEHVIETLERVAFSHEIQLDVVDGKFTETISWPYQPTGEPIEVKAQTDQFTLEVDLMVTDAFAAAESWIVAGADMIIFHIETIDLEAMKKFIEMHRNVTFGVAAHGDTSVEKIISYAKAADYVQLMGIYEIGAQGQPFDEAVLEKVERVRQEFPDMTIAVDGSVNQDTIVRLRDAGVNRFIVGSAIVLQDDPEAAHRELSALIS